MEYSNAVSMMGVYVDSVANIALELNRRIPTAMG